MDMFLITCVAALLGALFLFIYQKIRLSTFAQISKEMIQAAEKKAKELQEVAVQQTKEQEQKRYITALKEENAFRQKEEKHERKVQELVQKLIEIEKKEKEWRIKQEQQASQIHELNQTKLQAEKELARIASLTREDAKKELIETARATAEKECQVFYSKKLSEVEEKVEMEATRLIHSAILRCSEKQTPESSLIFLTLPSDDAKSRIIGREGRNIRAFEQIAGVALVIDETPGVIGISSFDAIRRHKAKLALSELIKDGRIHPARIEEVFGKIEATFELELSKLGGEAAFIARVPDLHPEILRFLGKLKFKTSLGQNVLEHSIEVSHIMGLIAAELKLNEHKARRIGLLHDIGKALPAEYGHSHAIAGQHFAMKYGEKEDICNGIGCHHDEIAPSSKEGALCKAADRISASRPFARAATGEKHTSKLEHLEKLALECAGVDAAYALQAGRELRVFVKPELIDDLQAKELAHLIAKKIEASLSQAGKVQITVVRERKAVEFTA